jgi:hypothetical protein
MGGNNSQSDKTKIETDSASAYRNVNASSNSENPKKPTNSKKAKQERKGYFNRKTVSIGIGILLFIGLIVFCFVYLGFNDRDSDGTADKNDSCPEIRGLNKFNGCPDSDNDGIPDNDDRCPDVFGEEVGGCLDSDNDGIPDIDDRCPDVFGEEVDGCLKIGQKYQGGIIFYVDNSGKHGKICAKVDLGKLDWYEAMEECQNLNLNGYSDWYLPNKKELDQMFRQRKVIGNFVDEYESDIEYCNYWSSTNTNKWNPEGTNFGLDSDNGFGAQETNLFFVRAIRDF